MVEAEVGILYSLDYSLECLCTLVATAAIRLGLSMLFPLGYSRHWKQQRGKK